MELGGTMRRLVVLLVMMLGACSASEKMLYQTQFAGVAFDTVKDGKVAGKYQSRSTFDPKKTPDAGDVSLQTLANGVQAVQKDGYDLVTYSSPSGGKLTYSNKTSNVVYVQYPAIIYVVQGYKSADPHPPNARPTDVVLANIAAVREKRSGAKAVPAEQ
jgi:hypothetical protein